MDYDKSVPNSFYLPLYHFETGVSAADSFWHEVPHHQLQDKAHYVVAQAYIIDLRKGKSF